MTDIEEIIEEKVEEVVEESSLFEIGFLDNQEDALVVEKTDPGTKEDEDTKEPIEELVVDPVEAKGDGEEEEIAAKKPGEEEPKKAAADTIDWEGEDNPYKKRFQATQAWGNQANQDKLALEKQNQVLEQNVTSIREELELDAFVPEKAAEVDEQTTSHNEFVQRLVISEKAAYAAYGKGDLAEGEKIVEELVGVNSGFVELVKSNPAIKQRFTSAVAPVAEAIVIMQEQAKLKLFGNKSIAEIKQDLVKEVEAEKQIKKKLKGAPKELPRGSSIPPGKEQYGTTGKDSLSSLTRLG